MGKRALSALVLIPPVFVLVWFDPFGWSVFALGCLLVVGLLLEFSRLANRREAGLSAFDLALMSLISLYWMTEVRVVPLTRYSSASWVLLAIGAFVPVLATGRIENALRRSSVVSFGALYIGWCFGRHALLLDGVVLGGVVRGRWLLVLLGSVWLCDTAAYLVGRAFGRHALAPTISPNKTWEGCLAGLVAAVIGSVLIAAWLLPRHELVVAGGGILIGVVAQISDLAESVIKRDVGVKDSGNLIPAHGGLLDRLDSLIFATPAFYYYLRLVGVAA